MELNNIILHNQSPPNNHIIIETQPLLSSATPTSPTTTAPEPEPTRTLPSPRTIRYSRDGHYSHRTRNYYRNYHSFPSYTNSRHYTPPFSSLKAVCIWISILNIFTISCIIIGSLFLHDCLDEPELPIFLIILGVSTFLTSIVDGLVRKRVIQTGNYFNDQDSTNNNWSCMTILDYFLKWCLLGLTISGTILVYHIYNNIFLYSCNHFVLIYSIYAFTIVLVMYGVFTFLCITCYCDEYSIDCC